MTQKSVAGGGGLSVTRCRETWCDTLEGGMCDRGGEGFEGCINRREVQCDREAGRARSDTRV